MSCVAQYYPTLGSPVAAFAVGKHFVPRVQMLISRALALAGLVASAAGIQSDRFDLREHPLDWGTLNATRGFCGMAKCYFPARLSEQEAGQAC